MERTLLFGERLVALGGATTAEENRDLSLAIRAFAGHNDRYNTDDLEGFLRDHPESPWRASLLTNLGVLWRETGRYGRALDAWQTAWTLLRADRTWKGYATADRAVSELALLNSQLGRNDALAELFPQLTSRPAFGAAAERITRAQRGLATMRSNPEVSYRCGPFAVLNVRRALQPDASPPVAPEQVTATAQGTSLSQLVALSAQWGEPMRAMRRVPGSGFVVPSVVYWRLNHYAAIVAVDTAPSGERVYVLRDPTFGEDVRTTERWLDTEASGYVLVPSRLTPPASWTPVEDAEAATVWGRGVTTGSDPHNYGDRDLKPGTCSAPRRGMAQHNYHALAASLHIEDTPVWLNPAFGPEVELRVAYNQADSSQSQMPTTTSFGGRWTFNWQSSLQAHSADLITHQMGGGGTAVHQRSGGVWQPEHRGDGTIEMTLPSSGWPDLVYLRQLDGSRETYTRISGTGTTTWYLTHRRDPQGNEVEVHYDDDRRITQIVDASGNALDFSYVSNDYADGQAFYLVSQVNAPGGRSAKFTYLDRGGEKGRILTSITDMGGIKSEFEYAYADRGVWVPGNNAIVWQPGFGWVLRPGDPTMYPDPDFLHLLRTPYGDTTFTTGWGPVSGSGSPPMGSSPDTRAYIQRWVETALPTGEHERIEFRDIRDPGQDCAGLSPCGYASAVEVMPASVRAVLPATNVTAEYLNLRNTYFWNATGYARGAQGGVFDPRHAHVYHWLHTGASGEPTSGVLESEAPPGESRVHYLYENQTGILYLPRSGNLRLPVRRALSARLTAPAGPASAELASRSTYTAGGQPRELIDAAGRPRCLTWTSDGLDLLAVHARRCTGVNTESDAALATDRLTRIEYYGTSHLPSQVTDPSGQVTGYIFNARGQVLQVTRPDGKKVGYIYSAPSTLYSGSAALHPALAATEGRLVRVLSPLVDAAPRPPVAAVSMTYYATGTVQSVEEGNIVSNPDGSLSAPTPTGLRRDYTYDDLERVVTVSAPGSRTQTFDYGIRDAEGALTGALGLEASRVYQPNGDTLTLSYDAQHRLIRSANGPSDVVRYRYNRWSSGSFHRIEMLRGAANDDVLTVWGLLTPTGTVPATVGVADSIFQQTTAVHLRQGATPTVFDTWTRDVVGRLIGRSDGTNQWSAEYRANGLLDRVCEGAACSTTTPGTQVVYEGQEPGAAPYHPFQRVHSIERFNVLGTDSHYRDFLYGPLGSNGALEVTRTYELRQDPNLSTKTDYIYDPMGRVVTVYNTLQGGFFLGYDANDRLASIRSFASSTPDLLQYVYPANQAAQHPTAAQMPLYGCQANFAYHGADHDFRLMQRQVVNTTTSAVLSLFNVQFDARDRIRYETNNATLRTYTYDANGRPMWMDDNTAGNWLNRDSYYDNAGNSTGQMYFGPSGTTFWETMTFDAVDRFISRTRMVAGASSVAHDARGRVTNDGDYAYQWNRDDRMTRVTRLTDGEVWDFRYDTSGRLLRFQEGGQWHRLTWEAGRLLAEHVGAENAETTLLRTYNVDGLTQAGERYIYDRDVRGSVRGLIAMGQVMRAWTYEPWGQRVDAGGGNPGLNSRLGFAGYVYHPETGLYFTPARVYRPELRRWLSRDPLGERATADGNNLYAYVANDPVNFVDPGGEIRLPINPNDLLDQGWSVDPGHRDPNGIRYRHPSGGRLDFHRGRPRMPGWRGKDHYHVDGSDEHTAPGTEIPDPPGVCAVNPPQVPIPSDEPGGTGVGSQGGSDARAASPDNMLDPGWMMYLPLFFEGGPSFGSWFLIEIFGQ